MGHSTLTSLPHWVTYRHVHGGRDLDLHPQSGKLLSADERKKLIDFLAANPMAGDVMPDTGGVRKIRYAGRGKGKRGGVRVIYCLLDEGTPLYALLIYGKDGQDNLTPDQKKIIRAFAETIKAARKQP